MRSLAAVLASLALVPAVASANAPTKGFPGLGGTEGASFAPRPHATAFVYAGYYQQAGAGNIGGAAIMLQGDPQLATEDAHTLAELAVQSQDQRQIVEIGWHVDALVNGDYWPHLFVFHWVNGTPTCYNSGCGWVQVSTTHRPGMRIEPGALAEYRIQRQGDDWWIYYQNEAMGYFPGTLWTSQSTSFTNAFHVQWFGEIAGVQASSCSEMGNGVHGASASAARMANLQLVPSSGNPVAANAVTGTVSNSALWSVGQGTPTSFSFGGPGTLACCLPETCAEKRNECNTFPDQCGTTRDCGDCATTTCTAERTCGAESQLPDEGSGPDAGPGDPDAGMNPDGGGGGGGGNNDDEGGGGCCDAGTAQAGWPALFVGALLVRRRRQPARARR